jgi:hypothetical protein
LFFDRLGILLRRSIRVPLVGVNIAPRAWQGRLCDAIRSPKKGVANKKVRMQNP